MAKKDSVATQMALYGSIKRRDVIDMIIDNASVGITTVVRGPNGFGKTAIFNDLKNAEKYPQFKNHKFVLIDMSAVEAGDLLMPKFGVDEGADVVTGVPHKDLGLHLGEDVVLLIDEIFKAKKPLQLMLARLLYQREFGGHKLSDKSIVFGASNLEDEGFGDQSLGFVYNRIAVVEMGKPDPDEWVDDFALPRNIHPTIIQSAKEYPAMFQDHRDVKSPNDNNYIFHPQAPQPFFVSGRSLERASKFLYANAGKSYEVLVHGLKNIVGNQAAMDIMAVNDLHAELPSWKEITEKPDKTKIPSSAGAICLLVYTAIQSIEAKTVKPWMTYLQRMPKEAQALFASAILRVESKGAIVSTDKSFLDWAMANQYMYKAV